MSIGPIATRTLDGQTVDDLLARIEALEASSSGSTEATFTVGSSAVVAGDVVRLTSSGVVEKAAATSSACEVVGIVKANASSGASVQVYLGGLVPVRFGSAPSSSARGSVCYLSGTGGLAVLSAPSLTSGVARLRLGIVIGADGADTTPTVLLRVGEPIIGG